MSVRVSEHPGHVLKGRRIALLIGIDAYQHGLPMLRNAVRDVQAVSQVLRDAHGYEVHALTDSQATAQGVQALLLSLAREVTAEDWLVIYFAGHGVAEDLADGEVGPQGYLLLHEADRQAPSTFLSMSVFQQWLSGLACKHLLLVLDCCFAGAFRWSRARSLVSHNATVTLYQERYERYVRDAAWQVLTSAAHDETAADWLTGKVLGRRGEEERNSPFAAALCQGLLGDADLRLGGHVGDGVIIASELHLYLEDTFKRLEQRLGRHFQKPMLWSLRDRDKGQFIFLVPGRSPVLPSALEMQEKTNPWLGLQVYQEGDAKMFFGRATAAEKLAAQVQQQSLTVVSGVSGAGKSSLVRAGLIPRLRKQEVPRWHILPPERPGARPLEMLAGLALKLAANARSLGLAVVSWCQANPEAHLLLVIDQAEELVIQAPADMQAFLGQLHEARAAAPQQLHIVLTLRSDFEPHFKDLLGAVQDSSPRFFIPSMTRGELREVIENPASDHVLFFEPPSLVDTLLDEVADVPGALPLLSFTLSEMYRHFLRQGAQARTLTQEDYRGVRGVAGALASAADNVHQALDATSRSTLRRLLLRMVAFEGAEIARRRVYMTELVSADPAENERTQAIIDRLVAARLLVADHDREDDDSKTNKDRKRTQDSYVEPAHDRLILSWPLLLNLPSEERSRLILHRTLTFASAAWDLEGRPSWRLWHADKRLSLLRAEHATNPLRFNALETQFLAYSARRLKMLRSGGIILTLTIIAALSVAALYSLVQRREAVSQRNLAVESLAQSQQEQGRILLAAGQPFSAAVYLSKAYSAGLQGAALRSMLGQATHALPHQLLDPVGSHGGTVAEFSPDGSRVLTMPSFMRAGNRDAGETPWVMPELPHVYDATSGKLLFTLGEPNEKMRGSFTPDGTFIVIVQKNGLSVYSARNGALVSTINDVHSDEPADAEHILLLPTPDGTGLFVTKPGVAELRELPSGKVLRTLEMPSSRSWPAAFSSDARRVIVVGSKIDPSVYDIDSGRLLFKLQGHLCSVFAAAFNREGTRIVTGCGDRTARVWDGRTGAQLLVLQDLPSDVHELALSPDGSKLLIGSHDRTARLWETATGMLIATLRGHTNWVHVNDHAFSPDGTRVVTAGDETARVWDAETGQLISILPAASSWVYSASFSPDGARIATAGAEGAMLWTAPPVSLPLVIRACGSPNSEPLLAFSGDGRQLIVGCSGLVGIWNVRTGRYLRGIDTGPKDSFARTVLSRDGSRVYREGRIIDVATSRPVGHFSVEPYVSVDALFSADGRVLITYDRQSKKVRIRDGTYGRQLREIELVDANALLDLSPDAKYLVISRYAGDKEGEFALLDTESGRLLQSFSISDNVGVGNHTAAFSADGRRLAIAKDKVVQIREVGSSALLTTLVNDEQVGIVRFIGGGELVITGNRQLAVTKLWMVTGGKLLATFPGEGEAITSVEVSGDGLLLAAGSKNGLAYVWSLLQELRPPNKVEDAISCYAPFLLDHGHLLPTPPARLDGCTTAEVPPPTAMEREGRGRNLLASGHQALGWKNLRLARELYEAALKQFDVDSTSATKVQARLSLAVVAAREHHVAEAGSLYEKAREDWRAGSDDLGKVRFADPAELSSGKLVQPDLQLSLATFALDGQFDPAGALELLAQSSRAANDPEMYLARAQALLMLGRPEELLALERPGIEGKTDRPEEDPLRRSAELLAGKLALEPFYPPPPLCRLPSYVGGLVWPGLAWPLQGLHHGLCYGPYARRLADPVLMDVVIKSMLGGYVLCPFVQ